MRGLIISLVLFVTGTGCQGDVILLNNGDRLTGTVEKLEKEKLFVKTDYAGTVQINWKAVAEIQAEGIYQVEAESGARFKGTLHATPEAVEVTNGLLPIRLNPLAIVSIELAPEGDGPDFWERLGGSIDLGYSLARGNSQFSQSSTGISLRYRMDRYKFESELASIFSEQSDAPKTSRHTLNSRLDIFMRQNMFLFGLSGFERDDRQRLNLRSNLGGGLGWNVVKSARQELKLLGGFTYVNELFRTVEPGQVQPRNSTGEGLAGVDWNRRLFGGAEVATKLTVFPNLVTTGRYRLVFDSVLRVPVAGRFTWNIRVFDRYDSDPPVTNLRNDYGLISGLGFTF